MARADEERARAHAGLNELQEAVAAYAAAARAIAVNRRGGAAFVQLVIDCLHLCAAASRHELSAGLLSGVFLGFEGSSTEQDDRISI